MTALLDGPKANEKKIEGLRLQLASGAKATAHLVTLLKDHRSNYLRVTAANRELRRKVNEVERETLEVVFCGKLSGNG